MCSTETFKIYILCCLFYDAVSTRVQRQVVGWLVNEQEAEKISKKKDHGLPWLLLRATEEYHENTQ
jgi:hypothetical protein